ncbi:hypothetical protein GALMADRAFT_242351 [Galerina marginata CBS 339.88]|uniref:WW domain-containing protein n=1 Tax=Galerina marginata (strain CBS 339.88) TaxID=685588 RepID=A0A067TA79_GALM3|nr:hypothetical protein GALMADRAFT_242351 [Galerina marginata CBS 339.88]
MVTTSRLLRLLVQIRQYFLRILKDGTSRPQAPVQLLRRLAAWWSFFHIRWKSWRKPSRGLETSPSSDAAGFRKGSGPVEPSKEQAQKSELSDIGSAYTLNPNGETISLDKVACSLYPFDAGGIRSASRSSHNLRLAREAHDLTIANRNTSRSSRRLGSEYSRSALSISSNGDPESYTFTIRSPTSPAPARQYSISLPQLPRNDHEIPTLATNQRPDLSFPLESCAIEDPSPTSNYIPITHLPEVDSPEIDASSMEIPSSQLGLEQIEISSSRSSSPFSISHHSDNNSLHEINATSAGVYRLPATPVYLEDPRILPVMPAASQRYTRKPRIPKKDTNLIIEPLTTTFDNPVAFPWIKYLHPEGGLYFYHKEKGIYADADLYDSKILAQLGQDISTLDNFISAKGITLPEQTDLVLDLRYDENREIETTYYYANHNSRTIFFFDTFEAKSLDAWHEVPGATRKSHLRHEIEAQYWFFLQLFPHALEVSEDLICELRDIVLFFIGDSMTSATSTSPYNLEDLHRLLPLTDNLQKNVGRRSAGGTALLARLMYMFVHSRFLDFHGETCSRIERHFSVYGNPIVSRTWFINSISPLLLFAPDFHLHTLQKMWVDGIMHKSIWDKSVKKMNEEWQEFVLWSTVVLTANVAFLAIQSVDSKPDNLPYRSPAQISSYLSVVASIGSIVLGLLLMRQNRTRSRESADEMQAFMAKRSHPRLGLETLAILYSLPYTLLMWGMVSFLAAFGFMCFQNSSIQTRAVVGPFFVIVLILIFWCMCTLWDDLPQEGLVEFAPELKEGNAQGSPTSSKHALARPTMLSKLLNLPLRAFLKHRPSFDSEKTLGMGEGYRV